MGAGKEGGMQSRNLVVHTAPSPIAWQTIAVLSLGRNFGIIIMFACVEVASQFFL